MDRPKLEVADVFRRYGEAYREQHDGSLSSAQRRVMTAIEVCRTAALGGHLERCDCCNHERPSYDSCRDRHCPKCQSLARAEWVEKRISEVLPTHYFHVVFTIPEQVASIAYQNKDLVYGILFRATAETLSTIAADPQHLGAEIGFFAVLHSWGQNLLFHPHLHCVVPGGGISPDGARWISCRPNFFLPVKVLSRLFRRLFLRYLQESFDAGRLQFFTSLQALQDSQAFTRHLDLVRDVEWVVYAKPPFAGPQQVVDYVGRYTHRVAISNHRERLPRQQSAENHAPHSGRVHPAIFAPRSTEWVPPHSLLRVPRQSTPQGEVGALPPASRHDPSNGELCRASATRGLP